MKNKVEGQMLNNDWAWLVFFFFWFHGKVIIYITDNAETAIIELIRGIFVNQNHRKCAFDEMKCNLWEQLFKYETVPRMN